MTVPHHTLNQASVAELRHSLRTPLNHVIGNGELLLEELEAAGPQQNNKAVREGLIKLVGMAREMVKFTEQALGAEGGLLNTGALRELQLSLVPGAAQLLAGVDEFLVDAPRHLDQSIAGLRFAAQQLLALARDSDSSRSPAVSLGAGIPAVSLGAGIPAESKALGPRVLLVDDSAGDRDILRSYLERQGYDVTISDDGQKCLQLLNEHDFALVLREASDPLHGLWVVRQ